MQYIYIYIYICSYRKYQTIICHYSPVFYFFLKIVSM